MWPLEVVALHFDWLSAAACPHPGTLHLNHFWPTSVPVPCQCNGFALIMQGREGKSHAERVRVHG